ncbi:tyrosyl-DNA phosphodiesterase 2 [Narcine bancroftii]|uniref:tyrosyl-DNA phosphodiesterase 2 n=1 Tax=Narcine bancroftii TaxID=1343680 RepID=UPI00383217CB
MSQPPQVKRRKVSGPDQQAGAGLQPASEGQQQQQEAEPEDEEAPLRRWRESVCAEFALVTGADEAATLRILAENEWLLERALNSYFEAAVQPTSSAMEPTTQLIKEADFQRCIDLTDASNKQTSQENGKKSQEDESTISLLTWNIDGLDGANLPERARGVCSCLVLYSPDIVFLQEVIEPYYIYLKKRAVHYTIIPANVDGYYTAIILKKSRVKILKKEIIDFPTTSMMRNLLIIHVNIAGNELCLMTSHMESTKEHSKERIKQLGTVLQKMKEIPDCATVIYGGDTNLRDKEVEKFGRLPEGILDVWEFLNKPEYCRYTWDTTINNNLKARYACRLRFDRVFFRASNGNEIVPKEMTLIGQDKLECGRFCSDHWGLICNFDVIL